MAEEERGGLLLRLMLWNRMREQGQLESLWHLPTIQEYVNAGMSRAEEPVQHWTPEEVDRQTLSLSQMEERETQERGREIDGQVFATREEAEAWRYGPERDRLMPDEMTADEQGEQAESRSYAEQDPGSEWYRDDLYHGQPGPDVMDEWLVESPRVTLDTSNPEMELSFQELLDRLDQRLDALRERDEEHDFQQHVDRTEGMSY